MTRPTTDDVVAALRGRGPVAFLDATCDDDGLGGWSYIGAEPVGAIYAWGDRVLHVGGDGSRRLVREDPFAALERRVAELGREIGPRAPGDPRGLRAGAIGWLGYELGRVIERLPAPADDRRTVPDLAFWLFPDLLARDNVAGTWHGGTTALRHAARTAPGRFAPTPAPSYDLRADFDRTRYVAAVGRLREHIFAGDVYQVNLSQRFRARLREDPFTLYRRLRATRAAPLGAFLEVGGRAVLSNSPELFLRKRGRDVETRPIKGTRARGHDAAEDRRLAAELLASDKDTAELTMIVDLMRNDLGKVATAGSVRVADLKRLVTLPTVHHLVATVRATLEADVSAATLLRATFPGGSITGCPKVRAMQLIAAYEPCRRQVYTGSIGWLSVDGDLDLSVAIRTLTVAHGELSFHAGGGIVADSDAGAEYDETLAKARAFFELLGSAPAA